MGDLEAGRHATPTARSREPRATGPERGAWQPLLPAAGFVLAAIVLTLPVAASLDAPSSVRGDYFSNLWNFWWVRTALFESFASPYWTDVLHFPDGIDLGRHTLSPLNALSGALLGFVLGPHATFNVLLLAHFAFGGWAAFLLARFLTGSVPGSLLAGLVYSFCPFHYYYLAQINVASLGFLPLAILFLLRTYRDGGGRNLALTTLSIGLLAASTSYYLVYALLVAGLLAVAGRLWSPETPGWTGLRRVALAGACGAVAALAVSWPLVAAALAGAGEASAYAGVQDTRANDLLGYRWIGPPEDLVASWPTMLGYSTLALLLAGGRGVLRQRFWLGVGAVFLVLSLGASLSIGGRDTGLPLPYALLGQLPVLSMLRKADRCFVVVQLVVALGCAAAWQDLAARFPRPALGAAVLAGWSLLIVVETSGVPFRRLDIPVSPFFAQLADDDSVASLVALPPSPGLYFEGRYNYFQTLHRKKLPQGYATSLALTQQHERRGRSLLAAHRQLTGGDPAPLARELARRNIDLIVLHKTVPRARPLGRPRRDSVWQPFVLVRHELIGARQLGGLVDRPVPAERIASQKRGLARLYGDPVYEDGLICVYRRTRAAEPEPGQPPGQSR